MQADLGAFVKGLFAGVEWGGGGGGLEGSVDLSGTYD